MNKKLIYSIFVVILLTLLILPILKLFFLDKITEEKRKRELVAIINRYFDKEEYNLAGDLTESLLLKHADDKELGANFSRLQREKFAPS